MKTILILLSTYNGDKYIEEQINSLINQEGVKVKILVRDDGSSDRTVSILKKIQKKYDLSIINGDNIGYAASFMTLVQIAKQYKADYYAFCDQDDVWEKNKLFVAASNLDTTEPALYLSQAKIVDEQLNPMKSSFHKRKVKLGAVLEHNYAIGCTMVFNEPLREILSIDIENMCLTCGHDSWVYLVALSIKAHVFFDLNGYVLYRQHGSNVSGKIVSVRQAFRAAKKILVDWDKARSLTARQILKSYNRLIDEESTQLLQEAASYCDSIDGKISLLHDKRMLSDYFFVDVLFRISVIFNRF